jgi:hypothetical protein
MNPTHPLLIQLLILVLDLLLSLLSIAATTSAIKPSLVGEHIRTGFRDLRELHADFSRRRDPVVKHGVVKEFQAGLHVVIPFEFQEGIAFGFFGVVFLHGVADGYGLNRGEMFLDGLRCCCVW